MSFFKIEKKQALILILLTFQVVVSQKREITILDKNTNLPIENVNVFYPEFNEGTFTNADGKASIAVKNSNLWVSNIGFEDFVLTSNEMIKLDTIYLAPKIIQLDEVIVSSFNLKKALEYVLDNYSKLYGNTPFEKECNFKETMLVDNALKRLILTKVNWWGKSYELKKDYKELKLRLGSIDYNKNLSMGIFIDSPEENVPSKSGFIETKSLVNVLYLNLFSKSFLLSIDDYIVSVEGSSPNEIVVSYKTDWKKIKDIDRRSTGKITFDKKSKAIVEFVNEIEYKNSIVRSVTSISKNKYSYETKKVITKHNFYKNNDNAWSLKNFITTVDVSIDYNNKTHPAIFESSIYVLKESFISKVDDEALIDLTKSIYQNLPSNIVRNGNSIVLTKEEKEFIDN
jgi:hypothetical protein